MQLDSHDSDEVFKPIPEEAPMPEWLGRDESQSHKAHRVLVAWGQQKWVESQARSIAPAERFLSSTEVDQDCDRKQGSGAWATSSSSSEANLSQTLPPTMKITHVWFPSNMLSRDAHSRVSRTVLVDSGEPHYFSPATCSWKLEVQANEDRHHCTILLCGSPLGVLLDQCRDGGWGDFQI